MQKLSFGTKDLVAENIAKLAQIFPNVIKEGKVDFELLKQELSDYLIDGCKERYDLNWIGKRESILKANTPIKKTLRPIKEKSIDFENTKNLYIEGDNFEALKIIQESYLNKIKMIYIDPPYNTGKDFINKDRFAQSKDEFEEEIEAVDEEGVKLFKNTDSNGRFHSDWLSMMYERLLIARDLLREDGVIFISIDDNEVHNLRHLCDEVFGEGNFVGEIITVSNPGGRDYNQIAIMHEYILVYSKSEKNSLNEIEKEVNFKFEDRQGKYNLRELRNRNPKFNKNNRPNLYYPIYINPNIKDHYGYYPISLSKSNEYFIEVYPLNSKGEHSVWRWSKEKVLKNIIIDNPEQSQIVAKTKKDGGWNIYEKDRKTTTKVKSIWNETKFRTEEGTRLIRSLFNKSIMDHPKSVHLLKRILHLSTSKNDIILDFFSGSATTAHAVMEINTEDNGNRRFIVVQIPEVVDEKNEAYKAGFRTIAEIGRERIIRAAKKIKEDIKDKEYIDKLDFGFRYFKVDSSNFKDAREIGAINQENLFDTVDNIKPDRDDLDLLFEVILNLGLELSLQIKTKEILGKRVYFVEYNSLLACFDDKIDENLAKELASYEPLKVVLCDSNFKTDSDKINLEQIFKELSPDTDIWVV